MVPCVSLVEKTENVYCFSFHRIIHTERAAVEKNWLEF